VNEDEPIFGTVRIWHDEDGWGVLDSAETPGGCWCPFSALAMDGYRSLASESSVEFLFEQAEQDGFRYRAIEAWQPGRRRAQPPPETGSTAYRSTLEIEWRDTKDVE